MSVHEGHGAGSPGLDAMAAAATLHCLTGCAVGEIAGLVVGAGLGLGTAATVVVSVGLAFVFGYTLSTLPLLRAGLAVGAALSVVLAADTLSIVTMEVVDTLVVLVLPGAMEAGLVDALFWLSLLLALGIAYGAAFPVNRALLRRGRGHALTHGYHAGHAAPAGWRARVPDVPSTTLAAVLLAFVLGGLLVAIAHGLGAR